MEAKHLCGVLVGKHQIRTRMVERHQPGTPRRRRQTRMLQIVGRHLHGMHLRGRQILTPWMVGRHPLGMLVPGHPTHTRVDGAAQHLEGRLVVLVAIPGEVQRLGGIREVVVAAEVDGVEQHRNLLQTVEAVDGEVLLRDGTLVLGFVFCSFLISHPADIRYRVLPHLPPWVLLLLHTMEPLLQAIYLRRRQDSEDLRLITHQHQGCLLVALMLRPHLLLPMTEAGVSLHLLRVPVSTSFPILSPSINDFQPSDGQDWIYDGRLRDILKRMKIEIRGTHADNYLDGDYERRTGRIIAAVKTNTNFESSATIQFDPSPSEPNGETRSILVKYITAVQPTMTNEQAVILRGSQTGVVVVCRGDPDEGMLVTVSPVGGSTVIQEEEKENLVALYPEM